MLARHDLSTDRRRGPAVSPHAPEALVDRYRRVRARTEELCEPLEVEDYVVQSMPDASPTKWHLCHVTWFFEQFVLRAARRDYRSPLASSEVLFNSYYVQAGPRFPRARRGVLSRPTVAECYRYRASVDDAMEELLAELVHGVRGGERATELQDTIELGLQHEQQHQELILVDLKHMLSENPLHPPYRARLQGLLGNVEQGAAPELGWIGCEGGLVEIGHCGAGFAFDNELPPHRVRLEPFELADRLVTNAEYLEFVADGGYARPELWLSEGWATVEANGWRAPAYWLEHDGGWHLYTLAGVRPLDPAEPVCHLSYFEADAFARWSGARLPTEVEWEVVASPLEVAGRFADDDVFHPAPAPEPGARDGGPAQMFGDAWEWTQSHYSPYPGYRPATGAIGEYNGKFMCGQFVLRGGACTTPRDHVRASYRNFLPPAARWFCSGIRLAREID